MFTITRTTDSCNLAATEHGKRDDYRAAGVGEYLVLCVEEQELRWFNFKSRREITPDARGIYRSRIFPGLWIDGPALLARDSARLADAVRQGLASREHARFVERLQAARRQRRSKQAPARESHRLAEPGGETSLSSVRLLATPGALRGSAWGSVASWLEERLPTSTPFFRPSDFSDRNFLTAEDAPHFAKKEVDATKLRAATTP